jgi:hypothetical protein
MDDTEKILEILKRIEKRMDNKAREEAAFEDARSHLEELKEITRLCTEQWKLAREAVKEYQIATKALADAIGRTTNG